MRSVNRPLAPDLAGCLQSRGYAPDDSYGFSLSSKDDNFQSQYTLRRTDGEWYCFGRIMALDLAVVIVAPGSLEPCKIAFSYWLPYL